MSVLSAILVGLLRGATTFLPISSSGHQAILEGFAGFKYPGNSGLFELLLNISTLLSIIMAYRKEISEVISDTGEFLRGREPEDPMSEGRLSPYVRLIYLIILGTLPLILSIPINDRLGILMEKTLFVGFAFVVTGALLFFTDKLIRAGRKNEKTINAKDALIVGIAQACSAIPGLSRIGVTLSVGMTRGFSKDFAVRFAVFLSLPSVVVSIIISFFSSFRATIDWSSFFAYLVGFIVSVFVGYLAILVLRLVAARRKLRLIAYYVWAIGAFTIIMSLIRG